MFKLHKLVLLKEPAYDKAKWNVIQPTDDPQWLEKSSAPVAWPTAYLHVHYAAGLEKSHPSAAAILSKIKLNTDVVSAWTYAVVVDKVDPLEYAKKWIKGNGNLVNAWLK